MIGPSNPLRPAAFLDRDGVLVEDIDLITRPGDFRILEGVPVALARLHRAGRAMVVVSNQAAVARGLVSEADVRRLNAHLESLLVQAGAPPMDAWYFCPHHPSATVPAYRVECPCRKPRPGMLLRAASELGLDLAASTMVGDRLSDIVAGARAGCRTVLVETGRHLEPPIESSDPMVLGTSPDATRANLAEAVDWILGKP